MKVKIKQLKIFEALRNKSYKKKKLQTKFQNITINH